MTHHPAAKRTATEAEIIDIESRRRSHGWRALASIANTDKRDAIQIYARLGLHPILLHGIDGDGACTCRRADCATIGKHPVHAAWQRGRLDIDSLDRELVARWRLNIGLRMGAQPSGDVLVAIDVDGDRELLEPVEREHGPLPRTLTAKTARGTHLIYRVPPGLEIRNRVRLAPGVDVRAEGGQIVAPPSLHASGARYAWQRVQEPEALP